ncbi:MAG: sigma-54-dependent Fis family transcriptional regulator [Fusobacteriaceae bacterium]|nr:sigma-54-dependent Fis family transcriptional regulator [Fusobacteriaceae bacterium]MBP9596062.1 sigma-54-dependent Fis family transcriptional regulator [Fusobacteriaceae bacterium]MBU9918736.1 sigma 54-interacting transcriptional regulator [Fusobacteriaceae bacterium]
MKILGLLPNKREEKEIRRVIENITLLDNYTELFEKLKSDYFNILLLWTDEIKEELLLELIFRAKEINKELLVYVLGEKASIQLVAGSISAGAKDYILKPYDVQKLIFTLERDLKKNQIKSSGKKINYDIMLGSTKEMVDLYKNIGRFSLSNETVFINGENGTGKELLAKILHEFNKKEIGEFLVIHGNINELADKVIFGEEIYDGNKLLEVKQSSLEKASNGTILIKEVENLSLETQIKLLEFIETGNFVRINGKEKVNSKTRIICSSSKNLEEMVEENRFYEGLWDKIEKNTLYIPPLREKKDDLPELIEYFIDIFNDELKLNIKGVDKLALNKIMKYNFPNNIKELKSVIKASMALARNEYIIVEDLPAQVIGTKISKRYGAVHDWVLADWIEGELDMLEKTNEGEYYDSLISRVERELIRQVLERTKGKKVEAAELLGITRTTLRTKMNSYGLD